MDTERGKSGAVDRCDTALLLIDVINDFDFPQGNQLLKHALPAAKKIAALKKRLRRRKIPTIYVNDNFGRWKSDFRSQVDRCLQDDSRGADVARLLIPAEDDYFVLKPKHSVFFATTLEVLLSALGARRLILTGFATDICVLFSANDAYMREYEIIAPSDCSAAETKAGHSRACHHMRRFLKADTTPSTRLKL